MGMIVLLFELKQHSYLYVKFLSFCFFLFISETFPNTLCWIIFSNHEIILELFPTFNPRIYAQMWELKLTWDETNLKIITWEGIVLRKQSIKVD